MENTMNNIKTTTLPETAAGSKSSAVTGCVAARKEVVGDCILYHGDCLEILNSLSGVDAVITDPPYGVELGKTSGTGGKHGLKIEAYSDYQDTYENYMNTVVPAIQRSVEKFGRAGVFIGPHIHEMPKFDALGGVYCSAATGRHQWGFKNFLPVLLYGTYPDLNKGAKIPTVLASNAIAEKNGHPCPKPREWMVWLVSLVTRPSETVLDPFMGSGTTGIACIKMGRKFIGIEKDAKYFEIALSRIKKESAQGRLF